MSTSPACCVLDVSSKPPCDNEVAVISISPPLEASKVAPSAMLTAPSADKMMRPFCA